MNILVTGATGYVGTHLVTRLVQEHTVRALVRKSSQTDALRQLGIEVCRAEFISTANLMPALENIEVVYHLAGALPNAALSQEEFYSINTIAVRYLLQACKQTRTLKQFIHCSTAYVCWHETPFANEETIPRPTTLYERTKLGGEEIARKAIGKTHFPITIVRPGFIYGRDEKGLLPLFLAIKQGRSFFVGNGDHLFELTHIDDVVDFFEMILQNEKAFNQLFIVSEKNPLTFKEIVNIIAMSLNVPVPKLALPRPVFKIALEALVMLRAITGIPVLLTRDSYKTLTVSRAFDVSKAEQMLNFRTKVTPDKGLRDLARWYMHNHWV